MSATSAPALRVQPAGSAPVDVAAGEVVALEGSGAAAVVAAVLGDGPGHVEVQGQTLRGDVARRVRAGLAVVASRAVAPEVPVRDHLAPRLGRAAADRVLAGAPLLAGRAADPAGLLSGGERTVLAWLRAEATRPAAVLLHEAAAGLDGDVLAWAGAIVEGWAERGVAVLVVPGRDEERRWAHRTVGAHGPDRD